MAFGRMGAKAELPRNGNATYITGSDRHCPKCQAVALRRWLAERETEPLMDLDVARLSRKPASTFSGAAANAAMRRFMQVFSVKSRTDVWRSVPNFVNRP